MPVSSRRELQGGGSWLCSKRDLLSMRSLSAGKIVSTKTLPLASVLSNGSPATNSQTSALTTSTASHSAAPPKQLAALAPGLCSSQATAVPKAPRAAVVAAAQSRLAVPGDGAGAERCRVRAQASRRSASRTRLSCQATVLRVTRPRLPAAKLSVRTALGGLSTRPCQLVVQSHDQACLKWAARAGEANARASLKKTTFSRASPVQTPSSGTKWSAVS
mmetsp:Transcript_125872/g.391978  ORF Transcript_125872/g.391978 Transcript_125872/m.391978 type:complete len:218 (+) Transcript_125872:223-876(+)